jgi:hypothetical protein
MAASAQAELEAPALAFQLLGFGRLGLHGRIIARYEKPGQDILGGRTRAESYGSLWRTND